VPWPQTLTPPSPPSPGRQAQGAWPSNWKRARRHRGTSRRDNTGDAAGRTHTPPHRPTGCGPLHARVEETRCGRCSNPKAPRLLRLQAFEEAYTDAEEKKLYMSQIKARRLYAKMMKSLAETGNG